MNDKEGKQLATWSQDIGKREEECTCGGEENQWPVPWEGFVKRSRRLRN